jgi:hypothetical protein
VYPLWTLIRVLGIRRGEALGLIWEFVDEAPGNNLEWQCICRGRGVTPGSARRPPARSDGDPPPQPLALTMKIYIEVPEQATRDALGRLSGWLDEAGGGQADSAV